MATDHLVLRLNYTSSACTDFPIVSNSPTDAAARFVLLHSAQVPALRDQPQGQHGARAGEFFALGAPIATVRSSLRGWCELVRRGRRAIQSGASRTSGTPARWTAIRCSTCRARHARALEALVYVNNVTGDDGAVDDVLAETSKSDWSIRSRSRRRIPPGILAGSAHRRTALQRYHFGGK
ncbi:MAG: hypothetical protein U1F18_06095 [Steroidobacteraceae bacterium]